MLQIRTMKNLIYILFLALVGFTVSCDSKPERPDPVTNTAVTPEIPPATTAAASAPSGSVQHYICPNNCEGSGGPAAGTCPNCGTAFVHNAAFHNQQQGTPTSAATSQPVSVNGATQIDPPATLPASNASGVFHYICANGCAGGAAAQGNCATCGGALTHNQAYHNQ